MELLEGVGATVEVANDGVDAVRKVLSQPMPPKYDVVLMDLQMPEMDGYQATREIRSDSRFAGFPIIAMTAHATIEERQKCLDAGMNGHVSKPIDPASLFDTLERFATRTDEGACCAAAEPARPAVADADELPDVPGLNAAEGLARVNGNRSCIENSCASSPARRPTPPNASPPPWQRMIAPWPSGWPTRSGAWQEISARRLFSMRPPIWRKPLRAQLQRLRSRCGAPSLEECLAHLIQGLDAALEGADGEPAQAGDLGQVKEAVEQLSRYLAESDGAAIACFEAAAPHLRILFGAHEFEHFASLVENYAFSEAYDALMAAGGAA